MGCHRLTYHFEPTLFLESEGKKTDTPEWAVWTSTSTVHSGFGAKVLTQDVLPGEYAVRRGDTFRSIAKLFGLSKSDLLRINGMDGNDKIYPGDNLKVDRAFVKFENLMDNEVNYRGEKVSLGDTPFGEWLRDEFDNRRLGGYMWRDVDTWTDFVPSVLIPYVHIYSEQWRGWDWSMKAYAFDKFHK